MAWLNQPLKTPLGFSYFFCRAILLNSLLYVGQPPLPRNIPNDLQRAGSDLLKHTCEK